jgi:alkylhydroperoxidase/carboxymuconolactone decarboxylase family protein YurZ
MSENMQFDDMWENQALPKREGSLVAVAALLTMNCPEQLLFQLDRAMDNGLKKEELIEVINLLAKCSGWPDVMTANNDGAGAIFKKGYLHLIGKICSEDSTTQTIRQ